MATFTSNGTPITEPSPQYDIPLVCNNGVLKARHQSGLPLGYTLLDYIESTGTQYIDTGIKPNAQTSVSVKANLLNLASGPSFFGSLVTSGVGGILIGTDSSGNGKFYVNSTSNPISGITIEANRVYEISVGGTTVSAQKADEPVQTVTGITAVAANNNNIYMIGRNNNGTAERLGSFRYYYMNIYDNGTHVRAFVPAQHGNDVGMYDTVSGQFFTNAGTGTFTAGSTVSDPVEVYTTGPIETIAIKDDQSATVSTATCEDLLSIGTYTDQQEIIDGTVTRKVGVLVLDGTETWTKASGYTNIFYTNAATDAYYNDSSAERIPLTCTHLTGTDATNTNMQDNTIKLTAQGTALSTPLIYIKASVSSDNLTTWQNWLAAQYAAGTPVIVVYPLATSTTETVTGQDMEIVDGDNTVEITQASMDGLELEVTYMAAVSLTIQEVQDANLDPNVQVTIN